MVHYFEACIVACFSHTIVAVYFSHFYYSESLIHSFGRNCGEQVIHAGEEQLWESSNVSKKLAFSIMQLGLVK